MLLIANPETDWYFVCDVTRNLDQRVTKAVIRNER